MEAAITLLLFVLGKSATIFLSVWAIRYKAGWDYRLSPQAASLRWIVALAGYLVAVSLPGASLAYMRPFAFTVGLTFLCWPNFAYHLESCCGGGHLHRGRLFQDRSPRTDGTSVTTISSKENGTAE